MEREEQEEQEEEEGEEQGCRDEWSVEWRCGVQSRTEQDRAGQDRTDWWLGRNAAAAGRWLQLPG